MTRNSPDPVAGRRGGRRNRNDLLWIQRRHRDFIAKAGGHVRVATRWASWSSATADGGSNCLIAGVPVGKEIGGQGAIRDRTFHRVGTRAGIHHHNRRHRRSAASESAQTARVRRATMRPGPRTGPSPKTVWRSLPLAFPPPPTKAPPRKAGRIRSRTPRCLANDAMDPLFEATVEATGGVDRQRDGCVSQTRWSAWRDER